MEGFLLELFSHMPAFYLGAFFGVPLVWPPSCDFGVGSFPSYLEGLSWSLLCACPLYLGASFGVPLVWPPLCDFCVGSFPGYLEGLSWNLLCACPLYLGASFGVPLVWPPSCDFFCHLYFGGVFSGVSSTWSPPSIPPLVGAFRCDSLSLCYPVVLDWLSKKAARIFFFLTAFNRRPSVMFLLCRRLLGVSSDWSPSSMLWAFIGAFFGCASNSIGPSERFVPLSSQISFFRKVACVALPSLAAF